MEMKRSMVAVVVFSALTVSAHSAAAQPPATPKQAVAVPVSGPRALNEEEQSFLRDQRIRLVAQAKNDVETFAKYVADEHFDHDGSGNIRTKESWLAELRAQAAAGTSTVGGTLPNLDAPVSLRRDEMLVVTGSTACFLHGGTVGGKPVKIVSTWIKRDGRWQDLSGSVSFLP